MRRYFLFMLRQIGHQKDVIHWKWNAWLFSSATFFLAFDISSFFPVNTQMRIINEAVALTLIYPAFLRFISMKIASNQSVPCYRWDEYLKDASETISHICWILIRAESRESLNSERICR